MKILYIEPFYSGSHKQWIDSYKNKSKHNINILGLKGIHWKWRMHGGAITLAKNFLSDKNNYDLIIVSDMLNLPVFISLCYKKINKTKIVVYFHENQISYPKSINDEDLKYKRDLHYTFINYSSSLVSNHNIYNSQYHLNNYLSGLKKYLKKMPDYKNHNTVDIIKEKSSVLYIGCNLKKDQKKMRKKNSIPIILWNHRWEHDKNPDDFFEVMYRLKKENFKFNLIILGENFSNVPQCFEEASQKLKNNIIHMGYCENKNDYKKLLLISDVLPVTSIQDFFGLSIIEAVSLGVFPLLPERLSYKEILDKKNNPEIFYKNKKMLYEKLLTYINDYKVLRYSTTKYEALVNKFDWSIMVKEYDAKFEKIYNY